MMFKKLLGLHVILFVIFNSTIGFALSTVITPEMYQSAKEAQERLIIDNQNRLKYEKELQRDQQIEKEKPQIYQQNIVAPVEKKENLPSFNIKSIELKNASKCDEGMQRKLVQSYLDRNLTVNEINQLIAEITNYYIQEGYITTRIFIANNQNLKSGKLILQVQEGFIEDIQTEGLSEVQKLTAFPWLNGTVLNIHNLEQGLEQLNRLSSNRATLKLLPSQKNDGQSVVLIQNQVGQKARLSMQYDILSDPNLQLLPNSFNLAYDNLLDINDQLQMSYSQRFRDREQFQNSVSLSGSLPFGYLTFSGSYNELNYMTLIPGVYRYSTTSGFSKTASLTTELVTFRNNEMKNSVQASLLTKDNQSYFEDTLNDMASRKLTIASAGMQQSWYLSGGLLSGEVKYSRGLTYFGALRDSTDLKPADSKAQFHKLNAELNMSNLWMFGDFPVSMRTKLAGQYSWDTLYNSERFSIGDYSSVRGFNSSFQGDIGGTGSVRFLYPTDKCPVWILPFEVVKKFLGNHTSFYHQMDAGMTWEKDKYTDSAAKAYMASYSNGLMYQDANWSIDFCLAKGFWSSANIPSPDLKMYFSVTKILL